MASPLAKALRARHRLAQPVIRAESQKLRFCLPLNFNVRRHKMQIRSSVRVPLLAALVSLFVHTVALAQPPTEEEVNRFLEAYPVPSMLKAAWNAGADRVVAQDPEARAKAACVRGGFDVSTVAAVVRDIVFEQFVDGEALSEVTRQLESPVGKKLIAHLLSRAPEAIRQSGRVEGQELAASREWTPEDRAAAQAIVESPTYGVFKSFAASVGPRIGQDPRFQSMLSRMKAECLP